MKKIWKPIFLILLSLILMMSSRPIFLKFKTFASTPQPSHNEARTISSLSQNPISVPHFNDVCKNFYQLVCQKKGELTDPTGSVRSDVEGEKAVLQMYKEIIRNHRDWGTDKVDTALIEQVYTTKNKARIESAFHWVRHKIERFIDRQSDLVFSAQEKHLLKARLRKTKLDLPSATSRYEDEPDLLTKNEAYYERTQEGEMRLRIGGAYVYIAKSWFNLVGTLAHELAHAIDPCELKAAQHSLPAYQRLSECFVRSGLVAMRKNRLECGANDQLSETFSDWLAAEVLGEALKMYGTEFLGQQILNAARNSVRDLCDPEDAATELDLEFHPSPQVRIQRVYGDHPQIRGVLGCDPQTEPFTYCTLDNPVPIPTGATKL